LNRQDAKIAKFFCGDGGIVRRCHTRCKRQIIEPPRRQDRQGRCLLGHSSIASISHAPVRMTDCGDNAGGFCRRRGGRRRWRRQPDDG
jgi:hypothetical protein